MKKLTCEFIEGTSIVPDGWEHWFWVAISESAPFSWGDNNRSLVTACDFKMHCENALLDIEEDQNVTEKEKEKFFDSLRELGDTYIDLEN